MDMLLLDYQFSVCVRASVLFLTTREVAWYIISILSVCLSLCMFVCMSVKR